LQIRSLAVVNSGAESVSDDAFAPLSTSSALLELDLSGNRLSAVPAAALTRLPPGLLKLDLSGNRIKQLPHGSAFNGLNSLVNLDLSLNLYVCIRP